MDNKDWSNLETGPGIYEEGDKKNLKMFCGFVKNHLGIIKPSLKQHSYGSMFKYICAKVF